MFDSFRRDNVGCASALHRFDAAGAGFTKMEMQWLQWNDLLGPKRMRGLGPKLPDLNERNRELEALVQARALALELAIERLERERSTDWLTDISNRRNFEHMLAQEWNRAIRSGLPLGLVILDVDHFKRFNDKYGHLAGDGCLLALGHALARAARRAGDLVARYGGEEFVVLLPDTTVAHALRVASQIQLGVWSLSLPHTGTTAGIVTCSIGVACLTVTEQLTSNELVWRADAALYRAKRSGRNCTVLATESEMSGEGMKKR